MNRPRHYWLMKSEPHCFSFTDLRQCPDGTDCWDGVRNYQARNFMRDVMQPGDGVLFYHSNIKDPAIVGVAKIVSTGYPDHTALDPREKHFDPRATVENPIWVMVDVQYVIPLTRQLTRNDLRAHPDLAAMGVLRKGNRLSVQPVTLEEWRLVLALGGMVDPLER
ncbi:MAG: EVE domain-containing protein [Desulfuromonadales bacterium]|nr:EVE domain-containing protein [Desulfuromonadales bacterium]